ncbi:MAG: hypothetical protein K9H64_17045 [Bacteroidales bacterium]|nr:hypothetical protein [Bacteroidales bacterium]MCF8457660.1 hypothetical protein [Bacteroidales bacterium]
MRTVMRAQGVILGKTIELLHKTDLPDGLPVMVNICAESLSLSEKRKLVDELCGSWAGDSSLKSIFMEIENDRHYSHF